MRRDRRWWWFVYGGCAAAVLVALSWISSITLGLERSERSASVEVARQENLRLALWRMDSWLAPLLAQEAARPYLEYQAYYPSQRAFNRVLSQLDPQEVITQSSLVTFESEYFVLHFQLGPDGELTSPQAPTGNFRDNAEVAGLSSERIFTNMATVEDLSERLDVEQLQTWVACGEEKLERDVNDAPVQMDEQQSDAPQQQLALNRRELQKRVRSLYAAKQAGENWNGASNSGATVAPDDVSIGPFLPLWLGTPGERLCYVRRVAVMDDVVYQGFLADWDRLRDGLLEETRDALPGLELAPVDQTETTGDGEGIVLATVPARAVVPPAEVPPVVGWTPGRTAIGITWAAMLLAIGAGAITLHRSIAYGESRSRFASTVTHELRTPLTTFRMYSEMLADGMVTDDARRKEYLQTLQDEAGRLSALVENVLAYSRLEDGRATARKERTPFGSLVGRALAAADRRVEEAGMTLETTVVGDAEREVVADVEAVGQIVFNLVDNACKYAASAERRDLHVTAELGDAIRIRVRDHGGGIPERLRRVVFRPFERGELGTDGSISGVGLGLALSRGLARDLGGDLKLETVSGPGASFLLELPAA